MELDSTAFRGARRVMLLADGLIATTEIVRRTLVRAGFEPVVVTPETLGSNRPFSPLVISRLALPRCGWLPEYLRTHGVGYAYFLDDNLFEIDSRQDPYNAAYFRRAGVRDTLSTFLLNAQVVWVQSPPLATYLREQFPSTAVTQINAGVDTDLFEAARQRATTADREGDTATLRVGYPTTPRYHLATLIAGIVRAAEARFGNRVIFEFVGWWPDEVATAANVRTFPAIAGYDDFVNFAASRQWDVGLAPLGDSLFENCKTNLKFREYAALGVPGIYSDVALYRSCVEDGITGLLCVNDPDAWVAAISRLLDDRDLIGSIRRESGVSVLTRYSNASVAEAVANLLQRLEGGQ